MSEPSYEELQEALLKITAIAHFGGLVDIDAEEGLRRIRQYTPKKYFNSIASRDNESIKRLILRNLPI